MKFLEYLFCKYYHWQIKVKNWHDAPFTAMLIIATSIFFSLLSLFAFLSLMLIRGSINEEYVKLPLIAVALYIPTHLYFILLYKGKYKEILNREDKEKSSLKSTLFAVLPVLAFLFSMFLKMLQNQGKL